MVNYSNLLSSLFYTAIKTPDTAKTTSTALETGESKIFELLGWLINKVPLFFAALAIVFASFILAGFVKRGVRKSLSKHNTDDQVVILVSKVSHVGVLILGFTIALEVLGIDISGVVGLIGLGLGFAIQDIIKNFVSGALILIQEPFKIGDVIKVGEHLGKVENIEARSTNIKTFDGQRVIIPNADLFSSSVINFSSKLLFGVLLVSIGFGVNGALGAIIIASAIALIISFIPLKSFLSSNYKANPGFDFSELYRYSLPTMLAMFCLAVPANVDVILAKHFFTAHNAGLYTAASVLGKIVLFLPGAISTVMFPKVSKINANGGDTRKLLNKSLFYTAILSGLLAIGYWFFPSIVIGIPFGHIYLEAIPLIKFYGIGMLFFSLTIVLMRYSLAVHDLKYVYGFAFFTILEIILLAIFHKTMMEMIMILLIINILLFIFSYYYVVWYKPIKRMVNGG